MPSTGYALITGASSGIGAAYARALAGRGHTPILVARGADALEELAASLKDAFQVSPETLVADLADPEELRRVAERVAGLPSLSFLVHSAGFNTPSAFVDHDAETVSRMVELHSVAAASLAHAAIPGMRASGEGSIVFMSSLAAFFTATGYVPYSATKAFLNMLAEGLAVELHGSGVRVQTVCAGLTRTPFLASEAYAAFNPYERVPDWVFLSPEQVVQESLAGLERGRRVVVPGRLNRAFVRGMKTPLLGRLIVRALQKLSPRRPA